MLTKIGLAIAIASICIASDAALAVDSPTVAELRLVCIPGDVSGNLACDSYLAGVIDGLQVYAKKSGRCVFEKGAGFFYAKASLQIVDYINAHPELDDEAASEVAAEVLGKEYPCGK